MNGSDGSPQEEREVVVRAVVDGPRPLVFRAWTEARHLARWFGPDGFTTTTRRFDFRPGGEWEFVMHGPDGTDYDNWICWREIDPPERIVYRQGTRADDTDEFVTTVTLAERDDGRTGITLHTVFRTKAQRDRVVEHFGAIEGGHQTLARLGAYASTFAE